MLADMELVFHNCQTYTQGDTGSEYYIKAGRMLEVVRTAFHNAEADNARGQKRKASAGGSAAAAKRPAAASEVSQPKRPTTLAEILAEVKALPPMVDKGDMEYAQKEALLGATRTCHVLVHDQPRMHRHHGHYSRAACAAA